MSLEQYILYLFISMSYILSPGPGVFLVINYAALYGIKKTLITLLGNSTGLGILASISAVGIGMIVVSSPYLSMMIKVLGAMVLFYLGLKMILSSKRTLHVESANIQEKTHGTFYKEGLVLALTNPKPIIFFTSIYPQFITNNREQPIELFMILGLSFMVLSFLGMGGYAILSYCTLGKVLNGNNLKRFNLLSGIVFITIALTLLFYG